MTIRRPVKEKIRQDKIRLLSQHIWILFIFSILTVYVAYAYGFKRVRKVKENQFHLFVFAILMACAIFGCIAAIFLIVWVLQPTWYSRIAHQGVDSIFGKYYKASVFFQAIQWFLDLVVHCLFVMKYWVASHKI